MPYDPNNISRWYFGGLASCVPVFITHPFDLLKVVMQTQIENYTMTEQTIKIVKEQGFLALYSGFSATLLRQATYSLTRFGIYSFGCDYINTENIRNKILLSSFSGGISGLFFSPFDLINVRMQNDVALPIEMRRNYKNTFDAGNRIFQADGLKGLYVGSTVNALRGLLMTIANIACYEQTKAYLIENNFKPGNNTILLAAFISSIVAATISMPVDVIRTRTMDATSGEYNGPYGIFIKTAKEGPLAFFRGSTPAFVRIGTQTIILLYLMEQLRLYFGYLPQKSKVYEILKKQNFKIDINNQKEKK